MQQRRQTRQVKEVIFVTSAVAVVIQDLSIDSILSHLTNSTLTPSLALANAEERVDNFSPFHPVRDVYTMLQNEMQFQVRPNSPEMQAVIWVAIHQATRQLRDNSTKPQSNGRQK